MDDAPNRAQHPGPCWPGWRGLLPFIGWGTAVGLVFFAVYPATNELTAHRSGHWRLYLAAEQAIPFVPAAVWLYLSMYLLFLLPALFVPARAAPALGRQLIAGCVIGGLAFLLFPAVLGFERTLPAQAPYREIFQALHRVDAPHNLVPSLHVVFSSLIALACAQFARPAVGTGLRLWLALIVLSTLLVHQHHLLDVATALLLVAALRARWPLV